MVGGSLLHGLPLVGLPNIYNIYIYIYIYISKEGLRADGPWALIYKYIYFYFILFIFESMHLSERLQNFKKVALWFINTTQFLTENTFCFLFSLHF